YVRLQKRESPSQNGDGEDHEVQQRNGELDARTRDVASRWCDSTRGQRGERWQQHTERGEHEKRLDDGAAWQRRQVDGGRHPQDEIQTPAEHAPPYRGTRRPVPITSRSPLGPDRGVSATPRPERRGPSRSGWAYAGVVGDGRCSLARDVHGASLFCRPDRPPPPPGDDARQ